MHPTCQYQDMAKWDRFLPNPSSLVSHGLSLQCLGLSLFLHLESLTVASCLSIQCRFRHSRMFTPAPWMDGVQSPCHPRQSVPLPHPHPPSSSLAPLSSPPIISGTPRFSFTSVLQRIRGKMRLVLHTPDRSPTVSFWRAHGY